MSRFYAPKENVRGNLIFIDGQEAKHIINVMRLGLNDSVIVFDGTGNEYAGFIKEIRTKSVTVEIVGTRKPKDESLPYVTLVQAIPKKDKMDYIIEKATELGITEIIPIISERTIVDVDEDKAKSRVNRWRTISKEASKQCGRKDVPIMGDIISFDEAVKAINVYDLSLFCCLDDKSMSLKKAIREVKSGKILVFIGPEGDFSPREIDMARSNANCFIISLGNRVLKSDTAGLYVLSCLNYEFSK